VKVIVNNNNNNNNNNIILINILSHLKEKKTWESELAVSTLLLRNKILLLQSFHDLHHSGFFSNLNQMRYGILLKNDVVLDRYFSIVWNPISHFHISGYDASLSLLFCIFLFEVLLLLKFIKMVLSVRREMMNWKIWVVLL